MGAIGGYFELELSQHNGCWHYHDGSLRLNSARCAFEYVLRARGYSKVYLPYYTCDVMVEPIERLGLDCEFYSIDERLMPIFDKKLLSGEVLVYTNYYGVMSGNVERVVNEYKNVVIDNSQAFFAQPIKGIDAFYSARKFVGVADGAYLYTVAQLGEKLEQDVSFDRMSHLLKRAEFGAEAGYADFQRNDASLTGEPIKRMSKLTEKILSCVDYEDVIERRKDNFATLHAELGGLNEFKFDAISDNDVPMVYPYLVGNGRELRQRLIENKVFVARYWPNTDRWCGENSLECYLTNNLLPLPLDQRYTLADIQRIIKLCR